MRDHARPHPVSGSGLRAASVRAAAFVVVATLLACEPAPAVPPAASNRDAAAPADTASLPVAAQWRALAGTRVWFGHQSVGGNLMEGVEALLREVPEAGAAGMRLVAADSAAPGSAGPGTIAHFLIGHNGDPASKLAAFGDVLDRAAADSGVALMKFCYLDMRPDSDPDALFRDYQRTVAQVRVRHPRLALVHVTMPVTTVESGPKALLKSALGKVTSRELNHRRERYNAMVRQAYEGREPLFDLARYESTAPDGSPRTVTVRGTPVPVLADEYTDDGGHLNARGQRVIGARLVETLARAAGGSP